jgi:hypothetical protein
MISSILSRVSATVLLLGGLALLFAPDSLLPALVRGIPPNAAWLGQLLGAAWLGMSVLNWLTRSTLLGGIYGRPVVAANLVMYFVSALSLLRALLGNAAARGLWGPLAITAILAAVYGALMVRGPFDTLHDPAS